MEKTLYLLEMNGDYVVLSVGAGCTKVLRSTEDFEVEEDFDLAYVTTDDYFELCAVYSLDNFLDAGYKVVATREVVLWDNK